MGRQRGFAPSIAGRALPALTGASVVLMLAVGTAGAAVQSVPTADCTADAQGMMTMPDGMKMPVAQMPGCAVGKATAPAAGAKTASPAPTAAKATTSSSAGTAKGATGAAAAKPQTVKAGTGGQAGETDSHGLPLAPLGLVLGGVGLAAVAAVRLRHN